MFITLYGNNEVSAELTEFLTELKPEVDNYVNAKAQAQKSRMLIIGRINDYKNSFPQRSTDHKLLRQAMTSEWSSDVIEKAITAYNEYNRLLDTGVSEYMLVAESANPSQLVTLSRGEGTTLVYDAAKHLKQSGSLPSQGKMEQHLRGYVSNDFSSRRTADTQPQKVEPTVQPKPTISGEEMEERLEFIRVGVTDPARQRHLKGLVSNENLPYIDSIKVANFWYSLSDEEMLKIIAQKIEKNSSFETKVREFLSEYTTDVTVDVVSSEVASHLDNQLHNGIRWRR